MTVQHKTLSSEQIRHLSIHHVSLEVGLDMLAVEGWELVTCFPSNGYAPGCTTMFVFRRHDKEPR